MKSNEPFTLNVDLERMEKLEQKYNIHLHVEQYGNIGLQDKYYQLKYPLSDSIFLGNTLDEVEKKLEVLYGRN